MQSRTVQNGQSMRLARDATGRRQDHHEPSEGNGKASYGFTRHPQGGYTVTAENGKFGR